MQTTMEVFSVNLFRNSMLYIFTFLIKRFCEKRTGGIRKDKHKLYSVEVWLELAPESAHTLSNISLYVFEWCVGVV